MINKTDEIERGENLSLGMIGVFVKNFQRFLMRKKKKKEE